jgi:ABC-type antimicrobial peptide transport system permease subunit
MLKQFNKGIAFAFAFIAITVSSVLIGCNKSISNSDSATTEQVKQLAAMYNYTITDFQPNAYKVSSLSELKNVLQEMKEYNNTQHFQSIAGDNGTNSQYDYSDAKKEIDKIKELSKLLPTEKKTLK